MSGPSPVTVQQLHPFIGAEIVGADLREAISAADLDTIRTAFVEHEVPVFRDQDISMEQQMAFGEYFGELSVHPFSASLPDQPEYIVLDNDGENPPLATDMWHSDEMFRDEPPLATVLRAVIVPDVGGDTLFSSMTAAYEGLSDRLKLFVSGLEAVNDFRPFRRIMEAKPDGMAEIRQMEDHFPNPVHPVVRLHPESGKPGIYVSPVFTKYIKGMSERESQQILEILYRQMEVPEYHYRVEWATHTLVIWDNRSCQHYAPRDFLPRRRRMERVTIKGDKPIGAPDLLAASVEDGRFRFGGDLTKIRRDETARPFERMIEKVD